MDYKTFLTILNRPDGFKPAGTPGTKGFSLLRCLLPDTSFIEEFIRGFQVFDKEGNGFIGAGELRYVLTQLGEKMSDEEVDELLKGVQIGACVSSHLPRFCLCILTPSSETGMSITSRSSERFLVSKCLVEIIDYRCMTSILYLPSRNLSNDGLQRLIYTIIHYPRNYSHRYRRPHSA